MANADHELSRLLRHALRALEDQLFVRLQEAGYDGLRLSHAAILRVLDDAGTRQGDLADAAGISKQAAQQIVDELERIGVVERVADPGDRRAKIVRYTPRGRGGVAVARAALAEFERDVERRLGRQRLADLRESLELLVEQWRLPPA